MEVRPVFQRLHGMEDLDEDGVFGKDSRSCRARPCADGFLHVLYMDAKMDKEGFTTPLPPILPHGWILSACWRWSVPSPPEMETILWERSDLEGHSSSFLFCSEKFVLSLGGIRSCGMWRDGESDYPVFIVSAGEVRYSSSAA